MKEEVVLGGQAVIEGVMMKGGDAYAVAVRKPSGEIVSERFSINTGSVSRALGKAFLVRGVVALFTMLSIGIKALSYSAQVALEEEEEKAPSWFLPLTVTVALVAAVGLFFGIPYLAGMLFSRMTGFPVGGVIFNLFEGVVRIGVFLLYIWGISLMPDVRRVFEYHGAEHKVVNAWEMGLDLTAEEVTGCSRFHPRCGTSFIFFVLVISVLVFSLIPGDISVLAKGVCRLVLLPVVAGISYEIIKLSGSKRNTLLFRMLSEPGMFFQKFTTFEPSHEQVEVAIASFRKLWEGGHI